METSGIYQFHVWLRGISPLIWRRLLLRSDQSVADLHYALQLAFGWSNCHLNRFRIHGKEFGVYQMGGPMFDRKADQIRLADFDFRLSERFLYEYDFKDRWEHQIRLEAICPLEPRQLYPVCIGGRRSVPPEDCGGIWAFQQHREEASWRAEELFEEIGECVRERDTVRLRDLAQEIPLVQTWLTLDRFDRRTVNRRLRLYATGDPAWQWQQGGRR